MWKKFALKAELIDIWRMELELEMKMADMEK
jgi:hypothetical protein